jgi:alpha-L-rhamnosidase
MRKYLLISILAILPFSIQAKIKPGKLTCEYLRNPMVVDIIKPRLSWVNEDPQFQRNEFQTAWEIRVAATLENLAKGKELLWKSGKVLSDESVNVFYAGTQLKSRQKCYWQVRVWDSKGNVSDWSDPAFWMMGLLDQSEWKAKWIGAPWQGEETLPKPSNPGAVMPEKLPPPAPMLRKEFNVNKKVKDAVVFVTGLGYFEFYLNGAKVGNDVLVPNQTNYGKRPNLPKEGIPLEDNFKEYKVMYLAYDVTDKISSGTNAIGAIIGNGFYNPAKYWDAGYGTPRFICQLHITYTDGTQEIVVSDPSWKAAKSPIVMDMVFYGEHYDARLEQKGWCEKNFDDTKWENAVLRKAPEGLLKAHMAYTDKVIERISPVKTEKLGDGHYRIDFGQEISGWVHIKDFSGKEGQKIDIKYLQKYSPNGENSYTLNGTGPESYSARFTWFVFREIELINWPGELSPSQITAEAVYTETETTGKFESSSELINSIVKIWWRSQTDNMHGGIASDCPNRERSPYTGDGQVAMNMVLHNFDARAFYTKWIQDILGSQNVTTGYVPNGAPWQPGCGGGVAWGAAMNIMPWEFYLQYGDKSMLETNYEGMKGYLKYMLTWTNDKGIMFSQAVGRDGKPLRWLNLGDWSQPDKLPSDEMVHTFYLWRCADLTSKAAKVLGKNSEANEFAALAERTRTAFMEKYYDSSAGSYGRYGGNIFALKMGVPADRKDKVIAALKADIAANGGHLDTGIFGTQFFFDVLTENGLHDLAWKAMSQKDAPGYGYWVEQGATTSWEGWTRAGSGNHPMFGGGLVWLYTKLAGMNTDENKPGYRNIIFKPQPVNDLTFVSYSNFTNYGTVSVSWKKENSMFVMETLVPVGCTSIVYVPVAENGKVTEGGKDIKTHSSIEFTGMKDGYAVVKTGSGKFSFETVAK